VGGIRSVSFRQMRVDLPFTIRRQPDETTCGPTCLHAIYTYYGEKLALPRIIGEVEQLPHGGTLEVLMGCHALRRGYNVTIYAYNFQILDPTWFAPGVSIPRKLRAQARKKSSHRLRVATRGYLEFLELGGKLVLEDLTPELLSRYLRHATPILAGLSATYLYRSPRERGRTQIGDDIRGTPVGHFVVLSGYDRRRREVLVADPLHPNPPFDSRTYAVGIDRLVGAILLGTLTYDAALMVIEPGPNRRRRRRSG
jgi:hypothetical protein